MNIKVFSSKYERTVRAEIRKFHVVYDAERNKTYEHDCSAETWRFTMVDDSNKMQDAIKTLRDVLPLGRILHNDAHKKKKAKAKLPSRAVCVTEEDAKKDQNSFGSYNILEELTRQHQQQFDVCRALAPYMNVWISRAESVTTRRHFRDWCIKWKITHLMLVPTAVTKVSKQVKFNVYGITRTEEMNEDGSFLINGMVQPDFLGTKVWNFGKYGVNDVIPTTVMSLLECKIPKEITDYLLNEDEGSKYPRIKFIGEGDDDKGTLSLVRKITTINNNNNHLRYTFGVDCQTLSGDIQRNRRIRIWTSEHESLRRDERNFVHEY